MLRWRWWVGIWPGCWGLTAVWRGRWYAVARPPLAAPTRMSLQVTLDGHTHQLPVAAGEVLLQAMEHHGLQPPSACRSGACGACKCRVTSGQVRLRENGALSTAELAEGWTLAYQAEAVSAKVTVQY